jgi:hypothetical protein
MKDQEPAKIEVKIHPLEIENFPDQNELYFEDWLDKRNSHRRCSEHRRCDKTNKELDCISKCLIAITSTIVIGTIIAIILVYSL